MIVDKETLIKKLDEVIVDNERFIVEPAKIGGLTVLYRSGAKEIYVHSKYEPEKAGGQFARAVCDEAAGAPIVLYGLGLGYHVKAICRLLSPEQKLYVFEASLEIAKIAFEKTDIAEALESEKVIFCCSDDMSFIARNIGYALGGSEDDEGEIHGNLVIYQPSLEMIPEKAERLKDILVEYGAMKRMAPKHFNAMEVNRLTNESAGYRNGIKLLAGAFRGMPAVVVSAGASLDLNAGELKKVREKALIICVTRAAEKLRSEGVSPDFYIATDAMGWVKHHIDFSSDEMNAPLFLLSTADSDVSGYRGEKLIIYEKNSVPDCDKDFFVETGGSVATAAVSLCVKLGAASVIFVGQDLCYCMDKTHSAQAQNIFGNIDKNKATKSTKFVKANDGNEYQTKGNLYIYLKWLERFIERNKYEVGFFNATALGAVIKGAPNVELGDFFGKLPNIRNKIDDIKKKYKIL